MKLIKKIGFLGLVLICHQLSAQEGTFRIGFQLNSGFAWMTTSDRTINNVGTNLTTGLAGIGEYGISDRLAITTGLGLTFNRGGTIRHEIGGNFFPQSRLSDDSYNTGMKPLPDGTRLKYNLQYLDLPVSLKWRSAESELLRYYIEAPIITWGFTVQRRGEIMAGEIDTRKEDIGKDVSAFNLSLGFGGGIEYPIGSTTSLVAGLYFHRGLIDVTSNKATQATPNPADNPFDPNDDYLLNSEDSRALLNAIVVRVGILF